MNRRLLEDEALFRKLKNILFITTIFVLLAGGLIYSALWFNAAQKVKNIVVKHLSVDDSQGWKSNFHFATYKIANFPFNIEIWFVDPELELEFANENKTVVYIKSDSLQITYPLLSNKLLFYVDHLNLGGPDIESQLKNIKSPFIVESSSRGEENKRHILKYEDHGLLFSTSNDAEVKIIDSIFSLDLEKINSTKILDWYLKLSDGKSKSVFLEYDMSYDADFNRKQLALFDLRKIFVQWQDCCMLNIIGKFSLSNDEIGAIEYDGYIDASITNYKKMFLKLNLIDDDQYKTQKSLAVLQLIEKISPSSISNNDLNFTITKKDDRLHVGEAKPEDLIEYYMKKISQQPKS